ncbi:MAG: hypothetical protein ABI960_11440, partial [Candidatus Eisenbacteria bacterium]
MTLRLRLFAMGALVALVAVAAVWLVAGRRVEGEFQTFLERDDHVRFARVASEVAARVARGEAAGEVATLLARAGPTLRGPVAWIDPAGRLLAASDSTLARARFSFGPGDEVRVTRQRRASGGEVRTETFAWIGLRHVALEGPAGAAAGTLWLFPPMSARAPLGGAAGGEAGF